MIYQARIFRSQKKKNGKSSKTRKREKKKMSENRSIKSKKKKRSLPELLIMCFKTCKVPTRVCSEKELNKIRTRFQEQKSLEHNKIQPFRPCSPIFAQ
jgi:hypothetical protein